MGGRVTGAFEITAWEQVPCDEGAEGPKLAPATVRKTFRGELAGESTAELLLCEDDAGGIAYSAPSTGSGQAWNAWWAASGTGRAASSRCTARCAGAP
jgi:hypothetical protein